MAKIDIPAVPSGFATTTALNARFQQIEDEFNNKVLYRSDTGIEPNTMADDLDMGTHKVINVKDGVYSKDAVNVGQIGTLISSAAAELDAGTGNTMGAASSLDNDYALFSGTTGRLLKSITKEVETFAALATTPAPIAGMVVYLKQHTSGGLGGGRFQDAPGTIANDGGTLINNTVTAGRHWKRIDHIDIDCRFFGAICDGTNDDGPAFQLAVNSMPQGGVIRVPHKNIRWATKVVSHAGVLLKAETLCDISTNTNGSADAIPRIFWDGATDALGIMYLIAPTTNGDLVFGGGSEGIAWSGQSKIGYGIRLDNTCDSFIDGRGDQFMVAGLDVCSVGGSTTNFSRRNRIKRWDYIYGASGNPATKASSGVVLRGNGSVIPATQQYLGEITGLLYDGYSLYVQETDNFKVSFVSGVRDPGGVGGSLTLRNVGAQPADNNIIEYVTGYVSIDNGCVGNHFVHFNGESSSINQLAGTSIWHASIFDYVGGKKFVSHGLALRKKINIPSGSLIPDASAVFARFAGQWDVIALPDVASSSVTVTMPPDYDLDSGKIYAIELVVGTNGTSGGNYNFTVNMSTVANGAPAATPEFANTFTLAAGLINRVNVLTMTLATPLVIANGDTILLRVIRNGTDPLDTNTDTCLVVGARILFVGDGPNSGGSGPYVIPNW